MIGQIERGETMPSIESLGRIIILSRRPGSGLSQASLCSVMGIKKAPPVGETFLCVGITYLPGKCNGLSCRWDSPVDCPRHRKCWHYLSSRQVTLQVLSAQMSLTSVFGMGTGGPSSQSIPTLSARDVTSLTGKILSHSIPVVKDFFFRSPFSSEAICGRSADSLCQQTRYPGVIILSQPRTSHCSFTFLPAATMEPSDFSPRVCQPPAETATMSVQLSTSH